MTTGARVLAEPTVPVVWMGRDGCGDGDGRGWVDGEERDKEVKLRHRDSRYQVGRKIQRKEMGKKEGKNMVWKWIRK